MSDVGVYSIAAAAQASGVSEHTIRMWERRYGAVVPPRTPGRSRVFSQRDVDRLVRLRRLTEAGHAIRHVATLSDDELDRLAGDARPQVELGGDPVAQFLAAIEAYDVTTAEAIVSRAALLLSPRELVAQVAVPILDAIGARWGSGELRVYQEHTASAVLRATLGSLIRSQPVIAGAPVAIAGTLAGENHQLGAMMAALHAATEGWHVILLDDHAPAAELRDAAIKADARAILVSFVGEHKKTVQTAFDELVAITPPRVALVVGGRTAARYVTTSRARIATLADLGGVLRSL